MQIGKVRSNSKARIWGEFGLTVWLSVREVKKLMWALNFEPHIDLAFSYFTREHLEEAVQNAGRCTLTACWEKQDDYYPNHGELEDDAKCLNDWLNRAKWHSFRHDLGLGLLVRYYSPIHTDEMLSLEGTDYKSDPRNFEYCTFYGVNSYLEGVHYETICESLGIEWCIR
ncbi:MAG: hypothetical protein KME59_14395 [Trichormus sp. ATA11-4-KO1]|jgi:hypothetical protein|nr:hypothetical protein [Trichormus sp. ATA11-4-KO1]